MTKTSEPIRQKSTKINWTVVIMIGWMALLLASVYEKYRPVTDWFQVEQMIVNDTSIGNPPTVSYTRVVKSSFNGNWMAEIQLQTRNNTWQTECVAAGMTNYSNRNISNTPSEFYWPYPNNCVPKKAGIYRISTNWTLNLPNGLTKQMSITSNNFKVLPN